MVTKDDCCSSISQYMEQLIRSRGYPLEIHNVTTEDGYINSMYRVPHGLQQTNSKQSRWPVLIAHGLFSSVGDAFFKEDHLGYFLADKGFDVWAVNCRGTTFSRGHEEYDRVEESKSYWNFSLHEIGYYDLKAFIDEILIVTGFQKLFYIGPSQGAAIYSILMSTRPEYNHKIAVSCLLCPGIKFENASLFPFRFVYWCMVPLVKLESLIAPTSFREAPLTNWIRYFGRTYAKPNSLSEYIYIKLLNMFAGHANPVHSLNVDFRKLSVASPNTASTKQVLHYFQIVKRNKFAHFDYGPTKNLKMYGLESPPSYDLSKLTAPVGIFYSKNDMFYGEQDIDWIADAFGNCVLKNSVHDKFGHFDFMYNSEITTLLYEPILDLMKQYI